MSRVLRVERGSGQKAGGCEEHYRLWEGIVAHAGRTCRRIDCQACLQAR